MKTVRERIREVICDQLEINLNAEDDDKTVVGLGDDSLHCVEIVINLEDEFGIKIQDTDASQLKTINDIDAYLDARGITD